MVYPIACVLYASLFDQASHSSAVTVLIDSVIQNSRKDVLWFWHSLPQLCAEEVVALDRCAAEWYALLTLCRDVAHEHNGRSSRDYRSHHHTSRHGGVDKHQGGRDNSYRGRERDSRGSSRDISYRRTRCHLIPCQIFVFGVTLYQNQSMVTVSCRVCMHAGNRSALTLAKYTRVRAHICC